MSKWKDNRRRREREEDRAGGHPWAEGEGGEGRSRSESRYDGYRSRDRGPRVRGPFRRYPERGIAAGVIAGLARWLGWSTWAVRGPAIALLVMNPPLFLATYATLWAVMEREQVIGGVRRMMPNLPDVAPQAKAQASVEEVRTHLRGLEARAAYLEAKVTSEAFAARRAFRDLGQSEGRS
jgi:phage shock protein PspC (stress-responsive transcriptional regulator)